MARRPMTQAQVRAMERLIHLEVSLARHNDVVLCALRERGYAEHKQFRWYPTQKGRDAMRRYVGDGV